MTASTLKPAEIKAPAGMDRTRKRKFRRIVSQLNGAETEISEAKRDLIVDLVDARMRISALTTMLDKQTRYSIEHGIVRHEILPLSRQIDSTTALSHKIADKLGLTAERN